MGTAKLYAQWMGLPRRNLVIAGVVSVTYATRAIGASRSAHAGGPAPPIPPHHDADDDGANRRSRLAAEKVELELRAGDSYGVAVMQSEHDGLVLDACVCTVLPRLRRRRPGPLALARRAVGCVGTVGTHVGLVCAA